MLRELWLQRYGMLYRTNGYSAPRWDIYDQFLKVVDRSGSIIELGCGNGLLLRFLTDLSGHALEAFGVDIKEPSIREAKCVVFPERETCFIQGDLRNGVYHSGPFNILMANPLYVDQGYYEQVGGKIPKLHLDGSIHRFVMQCWDAVANGGRLVLWCYDGHISEIAPQLRQFRAVLKGTGLTFQEFESGPVTFWLADRSALCGGRL